MKTTLARIFVSVEETDHGDYRLRIWCAECSRKKVIDASTSSVDEILRIATHLCKKHKPRLT
jgi:hypothetical protein